MTDDEIDEFKYVDACYRQLEKIQIGCGAPKKPQLGCMNISHERFGFCSACASTQGDLSGAIAELACWQLSAMIEKGS